MTTPPGAVSGASTVAVAPVAPGRLGEPLPLDAARTYLLDLGRWREARKRELELLDAAALRAAEPELYTGDVTLSMSIWQAASDRYGELMRVWDDGRVDAVARDTLARLVWGRLESGGLGVNLPEATRLSDALAAQLRVRLSFDPRAAEAGARVAALRAALERLRELVKQEPAWAPQVEFLATRVDDVSSRAARGGDVDSALAGLEADAARAERDLVVTTAKRIHAARAAERAAADLVSDRARAAAEVGALTAREEQARALAARCVGAVADAPRFAVPDVAALGPVPQGRDELDAYLRRLGDVARALGVVEHAYAAPLAELDELRGLFGAYATRASRTGRLGEPAVAQAAERAHAALTAVPARVGQARALVTAFTDLVRQPAAGRPATEPAATEPAATEPAATEPATTPGAPT